MVAKSIYLQRYAKRCQRHLLHLDTGNADTKFYFRTLELVRIYLEDRPSFTPDPHIDTVVVQLLESLHEYAQEAGYWPLITVLWSQGRTIAEQLEYTDLWVVLTTQLAVTETCLGQFTYAGNLYSQILSHPSFDSLSPTIQCDVLHQAGVCNLRQGKRQVAQGIFERAQSIATESNNGSSQSLNQQNKPFRIRSRPSVWKSMAFVHNQLGDSYLLNGAWVQADQQYHASLKILMRHDEKDNLACVAYQSLGRLSLYRKQFLEAIQWLEQGVAIRRNRLNKEGVANNLIYLAAAHISIGEQGKAEAELNEALLICKEIGHKRAAVSCYLYFGQLAARRGDIVAVKLMVEQALAISEEIPISIIDACLLFVEIPSLLKHAQFGMSLQLTKLLYSSAKQQNISWMALLRLVAQLYK